LSALPIRCLSHQALRKLACLLLLSISTLFMSPLVAQNISSPPLTVSIGTGSVTGVYYAAGASICRLLVKDQAEQRIRCSAEPTGGSVFNVNSLKFGELEFGIVQSDVAYNAYNGEQQFSEAGSFKNLRVLFSLHAEPVTIVAAKDAGITSFDDLRGKHFNVGSRGSSSRNMIELYLAARGEDLHFFGEAEEFRPDEHGAALCAGKIDGFVYGIGHPSGNIQNPTASCSAKLVSLTGAAVEKLLAEHVYYKKAVIPGGLYPNNPQDTNTYGVTATLVTSSDTSEEMAYRLVKAVFDNLDDFKRLHPAFEHLSAREMTTNKLPVPLHSGAQRYFDQHTLK
jgi:TRAP transporter TAXI family solute receptor